MGLAVVTVASGGRPVVDNTAAALKSGIAVSEATNGFGIAVTKVASGGMPVVYVAADFGLGGGGGATFDVDYFAGESASWGSDQLQPQSVYISAIDTTVWFWQGWEGLEPRNFWCRGYNHTTQRLTGTYFVGTSPLANDAHGIEECWYDSVSGYTYVTFGSHGTALQWTKSTSPNDFKAWDAQAAIAGQFTYGKYIVPTAGTNAGVHHIISRNNNSTIYQLQLTKSTAVASGVPTWGATTVVVDLGSDSRVDPGTFVLAADGKSIWGVFTRPNNADQWRQDIFAVVYDTADGNFYNVGRSFSNAGSVPISLATMQTNYRVVNQTGVGHYGNVPAANFDSNGNYHICYMDGPSTSGPWTYMHTMWNGSTWSTPVSVGSAPTLPGPVTHRFDGMQVVDVGSGAVDLYFVSQSATQYARGGDISKVTRSAAGAFTSPVVVDAATSTYALDSPALTWRAHPNARVMWGETTGDETVESGVLKSRAYGDGGKLQYNYSTAARNLFATLQPLASQKFGIDDFITTLNASGSMWDNKFDLFYLAFNDDTSTALNWANPGQYSLIKIGAPTLTPLCYFAGDGAATKYRTGYTPSTNGTKISQNSMAIGVDIRNNVQNASYIDFGSINTVNAVILSQIVTGTNLRGDVNSATNSNLGTTSGTSVGLSVISRTASTGYTGYRNTLALATPAVVTSTGVANGEFHVCGSTTGYSPRQVRAAFVSAGLSQAEIATLFYALMRMKQLVGFIQ